MLFTISRAPSVIHQNQYFVIWQYAINNEPTNVPDINKGSHTSPDYWALHPTTGLLTRLLGFALDYWALHPTTGLFTRRLSFSPEDWALHPTTGLCIRLLGFASDYWALLPTVGLSPEYQDFARNPTGLTQFRPTYINKPFPIEFPVIINGILPHFIDVLEASEGRSS